MNINLKEYHSYLERTENKELKTCFQNKKELLPTRQPPNPAKLERLPIPKQKKQVGFFLALTAPIIKMVILKNFYLFRSNLKTNCLLGTINVLLVATVKMFYMCLFVIIVIFSIFDKLKN